MTLPITSSSQVFCSAPVIDAPLRQPDEPILCHGNITPEGAKALYAFFTTQLFCNDRSYTLRSLFIALDEAKCLGTGSVTIVGSYVPKILGAPFFQSFTKREVGKAFDTTPHDVDFRIALPHAPDYEARDALKENIEQTLKAFFGPDLVLEPFQNIEDPAGSNHFVIAGIEGSLRVELLWVTRLGRRSLFNEDGLHLEIPRTFWLHESGYVRWNSGEMPIDSLVENGIKNELSVSCPETVDKRGWGRLMVKMAAGKTVQDPSLIETFLLKALLSLQGNKGVGLARLLTHATRNLPEEDQLNVFDKALQTLQVHLGNPNLIGYTQEDLKTFITCYFPDRPTQSVWLYLLCKDRSIVHECAELKKNEKLKALIKERAPEVSRLVEAKEGASQIAALVEFCTFEAAWKSYRANSFRIPLSKFLLGIIRASLKYPHHLTEGVQFLAQESFSQADRSEALRHLFLYLPSIPFSMPRILVIEGEAALTEEELMALYASWVYPILIQEVAKYSSLEEQRLHFHLVGPEGERFVPAALKTFKEEVPLEDPLSYAKKHEATLYSVQFLIYFKQLKSANTAVFYLSAFTRHYEALRKDRILLEQAQKRLLDLVPYLSCEGLLDKLSTFEDEKILVLAQEANRFRLISAAEKEVQAILSQPPPPETNPKKMVQLLDLFCAGYALPMAVWLRWLLALKQKHFEGKAGRVVGSLTQVPQGNVEQVEKFWITLLQTAQKITENRLSASISPTLMAAAIPLESSQRYLSFLNALEAFLLAHVTSERDCVFYEPCFTALHAKGRLNDPKWIPLYPYISLGDLLAWSKSFDSPDVVLAIFKAILSRNPDPELIFAHLNKLKDKNKKEGAMILADVNPSVFAEAILQGYIEPFLEDPQFFPLFEKAAKKKFWALYQYPGLKTFFASSGLGPFKEREFYNLIVNELVDLCPEITSPESYKEGSMGEKFKALADEFDQFSEDFKYRLLVWSLDLTHVKGKIGSLIVRVIIASRFYCFGDARPCKESHFGRACQFIYEIVNTSETPGNTENYFLSLVLHGCKIPDINQGDYILNVARKEGIRECTDYKCIDPLFIPSEKNKSECLGIDLKKIPPEKIENVIERLLYVMQLLVDRLNIKDRLFYEYMDFIASQIYLLIYQKQSLSTSNRLLLLKCFESFLSWPTPCAKFFEMHEMRCRKLFHLMDQQKLYDPSHLRSGQEKERVLMFKFRGFAALYLRLYESVKPLNEPDYVQDILVGIFDYTKSFLENRSLEGKQDRAVIFSRMLFLLKVHPLTGLSPRHRPLRQSCLLSLKAFLSAYPQVVFSDTFQCKDFFEALIPAESEPGENYEWETEFLLTFPDFLTKSLKEVNEVPDDSLCLTDHTYLNFITYFFMTSRVHLFPEYKQQWLITEISVLISSFEDAFKREEVYSSQFSRLIILVAQLISPLYKEHQILKEYTGENGRFFYAKHVIYVIAYSPLSEEKKEEYLSLFIGSLSGSGYLKLFPLLDSLNSEEARLVNFNPENQIFKTAFNPLLLDWLNG